ncbi:hypothetical protein [Tsukamurella sp. 1534]|uniref:hypothetical protein n=1 Tax=Tsukamurella sp. 1534 TaxID=1151061 RepID=UPI0002DFC118|nr:hypothetical protein [Tsukamurella sp. 1534]
MRAIRRGGTAAAIVAVLAFAVTLMHTGFMPMGRMQHGAAHPAAPAAAAPQHAHPDSAAPQAEKAKQTLDAVHDHEAHDCAGPVVHPRSIGAPSLVAVLPADHRAPSPSPRDVATAARGPPPWTNPDLAELCLLRI